MTPRTIQSKNSPGQNTVVVSLSLFQGNLPNPGIDSRSPTLQVDSLPSESPGKTKNIRVGNLSRLPIQELPRSLGAQYATGDQWRNNSRKNEGMESKQKQYPVVEVTGDRSKIRCCKEQ